MKPQRMRLYFEDEAPRIGCGWRTVEVTIGYKWVKVKDVANGNRAKFTLKDFERMFAGGMEVKYGS
jgi:hypothetical protein